MRLFAAFVPPRDVLQQVTSVVQSVPSAIEPEEKRSRFWRRPRPRGAHAAGRPPATELPNPELDRPSIEHMIIPITSFGNVALADAERLVDALRENVATWERPSVWFGGAKALEFSGDQSVWATLEGDVDKLVAIGRGVPQVVQRLGFFVDRRVFRPWLSVGTITDATTAPYLERLVAALDGVRTDTWTVDSVFLMKRLPDASSPDDFEVAEQMPLS